jgi:hypothetical protein
LVIVWGGTKDVSRNESTEGLTEIGNFVKKNKNTNIRVINLPTRQDLEPTSCVNQEIKVFNRKLGKYMKSFDHASVVDIQLDREHHTRHGLHLNKKGKELVTNQLVIDMKGLSVKIQRTPIAMIWKDGQEVNFYRETTKEEDKGGSNMVRDSTIQNEKKLTDLANLKDDQRSQHIMKYGNKDSRNSTEDKQVKILNEEQQSGNSLNRPQVKRSRRPPSKRREDFFMVNCEKAKNIIVLHHNIQSLSNKIQELSLYLHVSDTMVDVLCFTEHWLSGDQIKLINLDQHKLRSQVEVLLYLSRTC